jgi:hypothetical protein
MKVSVSRHGGLGAAIYIGKPPRQLDTADLSRAEAAELAQLVDAATATPAAAPSAKPIPDVTSYTVTVENKGRETVLKQSDTTMTPAFAALLAWLESHLAKK